MSSLVEMPPYSNIEGKNYSLSVKPPFSFSGVTTMMFPLRASIDSLQKFCDHYLNFVPPEVGRFRAPFPYVYLMLLDYGRMAIDLANVGWLSQREIVFMVPLEWYKVRNGRWVFHDWASIAPFIYVDDDMSMTAGRSVYGWPKTIAQLVPTLTNWMQDPLAPVTEATLSTMVFPELYAGKQLEQRVFLEIERQAPMSNLRVPWDPTTPVAPWTMASNFAQAFAGFGRDAIGLMSGLGFMPMHKGSTGDNYISMLQKAVVTGFPLRPNLSSNTINLKQFRRSEDPSCYCYQALTNGPMRITSLNRAGLLGEQHMMLGDMSGGFSVHLHEWPSLPIIETLGLEVEKRRHAEVDVALIKPVMPFWYDVNMTYLPGYNLAWRSHDEIWYDRHCKPIGKHYTRKRASNLTSRLFNTTLGAGNKALAGPFHFGGTSIRVLPLMADKHKLTDFIEEYLNAPLSTGSPGANDPALGASRQRFELWAPNDSWIAYVYLTATSFGDVTSLTDNVGDWADTEVAFLVPVRRYEWSSKTNAFELSGVGLVPAFTYLDSVIAASSRSEVLGIPTTQAQFTKPESAWMSKQGPHAEARQMLLSVESEVLPVVGEGQRARMQPILSITAGEPEERPELQWRDVADRWGSELIEELRRKNRNAETLSSQLDNSLALSLELLANRVPISLYTLKQFRDVEKPDLACYQALVRVQRTLLQVLDLREISRPLTVHINEFPTQQLVSLLGLMAQEVTGDGAGITYAIQPIRPFWMSVNMEEARGEPLEYRSGSIAWQPLDPVPSYFQTNMPTVGTRTARIQDQGDARRFAFTSVQWESRVNAGFAWAKNLTVDEAREAVTNIDPQSVIDAVLSREWGSWDPAARWLTRRQDLANGIAGATDGLDARYQPLAELKYLLHELTHPNAAGGGVTLADPRSADLKTVGDALNAFFSHEVANRRSMAGTVSTQLMEDVTDAFVAFARVRTELETGMRNLYDLLELLKPGAEINEDDVVRFIASLDLVKRTLTAVAALHIVGEPESQNVKIQRSPVANGRHMEDALARLTPLWDQLAPIVPAVASPQDRAQRLQDLEQQLKQERSKPAPERIEWNRIAGIARQTWELGEVLRSALGLARERYGLQREALLNQLSRDAQKPDYVVLRALLGTEADRIFPPGDSWDADWYIGRQMEHAMLAVAPAQDLT